MTAGPSRCFRIERHESVGSTNDIAMQRLKDGDPGGLFIVARDQTAGRGRQGRVWSSPPSNLYASLALRLSGPADLAPQLGFVAGVSLAAVLRTRLGGDVRLAIKWPNDMIFAGAKLAGILLEGAALADGRFGCVVGFGVNCRSHPGGLAYPTTDLVSAGDLLASPDAILTDLACSFKDRLAIWGDGSGFPVIRDAWLEHAAGLGERIAVATPRARLTGIFRSLDACGRLIIDTEHGITTIDAGDVFLCGSAEPAINPDKNVDVEPTHEKARTA